MEAKKYKDLFNPKWLNRRDTKGVLKTPTLKDIEGDNKKVEEKKRRPILWFIAPILIGLIIATPLGIIFNSTTIIINDQQPTATTQPPPGIPVPPKKTVDTSLSEFELDGWQPSSDVQRYIGIHRPNDPYGDNFDSFPVYFPYGGSNGRIWAVNDNNSLLQSEVFSYSLDEDKQQVCYANLLDVLNKRANLPETDSNRIVVPTGYSIQKLHERIKDTYCTFYLPSRSALISEMKSPYINSPRNNFYSLNGSILSSVGDNYLRRKNMWFERETTTLGNNEYRIPFPNAFPDRYIQQYKVSNFQGSDGNPYFGDEGDIEDYGPEETGIFLNTRLSWYANFFYRYLLMDPWNDISKLYATPVKNRIFEPDVIKKTLVRPGMGPDNDFGQIVQRDYYGDTSFRLNLSNMSYMSTPGSEINNFIGIPNNWNSNDPLYHPWSSDFMAKSNLGSTLMQAAEYKNIGTVGPYNFNTLNEDLNYGLFSQYFLRATFDNVRNIIVNNEFKSTASSQDSKVNLMYLSDAYQNGPMRGLGYFFYESPRKEDTTPLLQNLDQLSFERDMYETSISTNTCSRANKSVFETNMCASDKKSLLSTSGVRKDVYYPSKENMVTVYYAKLQEANDLWSILQDKLEKIIQSDKYQSNFEAFDDNTNNASTRLLNSVLPTEKTRSAELKKENIIFIDALRDLFSDTEIISTLRMPNQSSNTIKNNMTQKIIDLNSKISEFSVLQNGTGNTINKTYVELDEIISEVIKALQDVVLYYAESEARRKLDTIYTITVTNSENLTFTDRVLGKNLTYHLYVRYMKMNEARLNYSRYQDSNNQIVEGEFKIVDWRNNLDPNSGGLYGDNPPIVTERTVKVKDATDGEMAYFVLHVLKDHQFPWIPLKFYRGTRTKPSVVYDIVLADYSTKYDAFVQEAENYINNYMSAKTYQTNIINDIAKLPRRTKKDNGSRAWTDFDVINLTGGDSDDVLGTLASRTNASADILAVKPFIYHSRFFETYSDKAKSLRDFMFYAQAHYMTTKKSPLDTPTSSNSHKEHCIVTYNSTGVRQDNGYSNVLLPEDLSNPGVPTSNRLLDYYYFDRSGLQGTEGALMLDGSGDRFFRRSDVHFINQAGAFKNLRGQGDKWIVSYFSKCISDTQYNNPLDPTNTEYKADNDEWAGMIKKVTIKIRWDILDIA